MEKVKSVFERLNAINVNEHKEDKNGLSYLSWAWAWTEVKKLYPNANYKVYERDSECGPINYFTDGKTAWVKTGVTIQDLEHVEMLPVMDYRNKSITLDKITSFDVNKTIQRSLTKALGRHGLGLYIYAGEDLPEEPSGEMLAKVIGQQTKMNELGIDYRGEFNAWILEKAKVGTQDVTNATHKELERLSKIYTSFIAKKEKQMKEKKDD